MERHVLLCTASSIPAGLSFDPNARTPNINRAVYKKVRASLLNDGCAPNTFHLKNKGITIVAQSVKRRNDHDYEVFFGDGHGIVDGGHTYELIIKTRETTELPEKQCVKLEILTGVPDDMIPEVAGGLNTSVQVQDMSLLDLGEAFEWIKNDLALEPYYDRIAWSENDPGDYDARDIISMMTCFDIDSFPPNGDTHPVIAYEKKAEVIRRFKADFENSGGAGYKKFRPILKDILALYDTIGIEFRQMRNLEGGHGGALKIVDQRERKPFQFIFIGQEDQYRLQDGALYPMLAAFRWLVKLNAKTDSYRWNGGFDAVLAAWRQVGPKLVSMTQEKAKEVGRNADSIGKSRPHWAALFQTVGFYDLMERAKK
jgi:hypothetical protein